MGWIARLLQRNKTFRPVQLGFLATKEEASHAMKAAKEFIQAMENLLKDLERKW
jgi:uncharacterized protein (UPF0332 family)